MNSGFFFCRFARVGVVVGLGLPCICSSADAAENVLNQGTNQWVTAAETGRADMLVLGDSVTWFSGHGWDEGLTQALNAKFGLAGTGILNDSGGTGQGYGFATYGGIFSSNGWDQTLTNAPAERQGYALRTGVPVLNAGSTSLSNFTFGVSGETLAPSAAYTWDLYTASNGNGTMGAYRRIGTSNSQYHYNTLQTLPTVTTSTPPSGLQRTSFAFDPTPSIDPSVPQEMRLQNVTNTSIFYSRLWAPGAKGVTLSSLGYGGRSTRNFYEDIWSTMDPAGRSAYLSALVDRGSGKLNVMLCEGFNDRNDKQMSINNVAASNTAAGFKDNVLSLLNLIRSDWIASGKSIDDLSFTLVGMYQIEGVVTDGSDPLQQYAAVEEEIAKSDPSVSFVDLFDHAPPIAEAESDGYLADGLHPSVAGVDAYSNIIVNALVPEPSCIGLLAVGGLLLRRRNRRT